MPFSVLRTWGLGLFSWLIIGAAVYALWEWADGVTPATEPQVVRNADGEEAVVARQVPREERDRQGGWPYLAAGVALLLFSVAGFVPVLPFLGKPKVDEPQPMRTGQTLQVDRPDGSRLHVELYGPAGGPTVVLTHGWSLDSTVWYYLKKQFGQRYRLVVWDLPGLGKSKGSDNGDYSLEKMAHDLNAVVQTAVPNGPVILLGHSIGGMISQTFCRLHREQQRRVGGIVLLHTTYTNPLHTALFSPLLKALEKPVVIPLNHLMIWLAPLAWLSNWQSYGNGTLHIFTRLASFAGEQTWGQVNYGAKLAAQSWPGVVARGNLAMLKFDEQSTLPTIDVPVLVVGGEHDRMTQRHASDRLDQLLPHSVESVLPAGHLGFWEQNPRFGELFGEFVEKYGRERSVAASAESQERHNPA